jgi:hypothetical protein
MDGRINDLANWLTLQVKGNPRLYHLLESRFHAYGLHGPYVRHELRYRLLPALVVVALACVGCVAMLAAGRRRRRRRRA